LSRASLVDPVTILLALASVGLLFRLKVNTTWLVLGGATVGVLTGLFR
jgi:chromate transporter